MIRSVLRLLTRDQRRTGLSLVALMLIGMLVETLGVGVVVPALGLVAQQNMVAKYPQLEPVLARLGNPTRERLVVLGMLALVGIYAIKAVYLAFVTWRQNRFAYRIQAYLSQRLFVGYLRQPYTFHLQHNSALLIRNVHVQVGDFTNVVQQGMIGVTEALVAIGITALLMAVEPLGAAFVLTGLALASFAFHRITRTRVRRWGEARQLHEGRRIQQLQEGLGGAKDIKLMGREADLIAEYATHNATSARVIELQNTLLALPRLWLELLAVAGLALLVIVMIVHGKPADTVLPTLGLFTAAAFRLMPSANRILNAVQTIRFSGPAVDTLTHELALMNGPSGPSIRAPLTFARALRLDRVSFTYPGADAPALRDVSLLIPRGAAVGFVGGSGAGKSTLVDLVLGLLTPTSGIIRVDGMDIQDNLRGWQDQIGYVPQSIFLTDDTVRRNVAFGLSSDRIDDQLVWRALRAAQLEEFIMSLPAGLDTIVGERGVRISGGQRQRIGIARALYHDPAVLVLDEATSSLDLMNERAVMEAVGALIGEKTLLIVSHRLATIEQCERVFRIHDGRLVDAGAPDLLIDPVPSA